MIRRLSALMIFLLMSVATVFAAGISPGSSWSSVNAHGGCVVYHDGYYYWFGECRSTNKSNGISCYRSKDLYTWTEQCKAVTPTGTMTDENADIASGRTLERPKVFYNATTGKWVMWIHWENGSDYGQAKVAVCQADHVAGPYKLVDVFRPNNHDSRDQTVFVDDDGIAYHVYSTGMNTNTNCSPLEEDYLHPQESVNTQLKGRRYEAASLFKVGETYYGLFSGCTGWNPNPGRYMWTQDLMGDWEAPADFKASDGSTGINFCTDNGKDNTYQSQSNYVFKVPGREKAFVYMGDRWNSSNIQSSKHVWLPLSVRSGYPAVRWYDEWDLSVFDDMYRYKRVKEIVDGDEYYLLERYSDRIVSRPKTSLTLENDGETNLCLTFHTTEIPYTYKIEMKGAGTYMESVYGTLRWQAESDSEGQLWRMVLQEDGYYRIENASDGVCLSVSGNSTIAGTALFLTEKSTTIHQHFGVYYDSKEHPDYVEADMFSKAYRAENKEKMQEQEAWLAGIDQIESGELRIENSAVYDLVGRKVSDGGAATVSQHSTKHQVLIVNGRKVLR